MDRETGNERDRLSAMQRVWVMLGCDGSRAHGPRLRIRILHPSHPSIPADTHLVYRLLLVWSLQSYGSQCIIRAEFFAPFGYPEAFGWACRQHKCSSSWHRARQLSRHSRHVLRKSLLLHRWKLVSSRGSARPGYLEQHLPNFIVPSQGFLWQL